MRKLLLLQGFLLLGYFAYFNFIEPRILERPAYATGLSSLVHDAFAPLSDEDTGAGLKLKRWIITCQQRIRERREDAPVAKAALELCRLLTQVNEERARRLGQLQTIEDRNYTGFREGDTDRKKTFFVDAHRRSWQAYVEQWRPRAERLLENIERMEARSS